MCGPGWWGASMGGFWWIFPLVGLLVCVAVLVMAFRWLGAGRAFPCMGGHAASAADETAAMRREIHLLRKELEQLKPSA